MPEPQNLPPLAANIRRWRARRDLSLSALARAAEVSKSTVSELENGKGNPSLDTLWSLATSLAIPLSFLFVDARASDHADVRRLIDAPVIAHDDAGFAAHLLASWSGQGEVELAVITLDEDAQRNSLGNAAGVVERAVCVSGTVEVGPVGRTQVLTPGDVVTFAADQPHTYRPIGGKAMIVTVQQYGVSA